MACANPNLQNQPTRTEIGKRIRECFIPEEGNLLGEADFSGIEMRVLAEFSEDVRMTGVFLSGEDIHTQTACWMFGIDEAEVLSDEMKYRYPAKRIGFGVAYGIGASALADQMEVAGLEGWTVDRCQEAIDEWFGIFQGVWEYKQRVYSEIRRFGAVRDFMGRLRLIPEVRSLNAGVVDAGLREGFNMPIQGGAAEVMKQALARVWEWICAGRAPVRPLMLVHDSLLFELPDDRRKGLRAKKIARIMEGAGKELGFKLPLPVDVKLGESWGRMGGRQ